MVTFVESIQRIPVEFDFHNKETSILLKELLRNAVKFDRIELPNESEGANLRFQEILKLSAPLLNHLNPCNTLIISLYNWFDIRKGLNKNLIGKGKIIIVLLL